MDRRMDGWMNGRDGRDGCHSTATNLQMMNRFCKSAIITLSASLTKTSIRHHTTYNHNYGRFSVLDL